MQKTVIPRVSGKFIDGTFVFEKKGIQKSNMYVKRLVSGGRPWEICENHREVVEDAKVEKIKKIVIFQKCPKSIYLMFL